MYANYIGGQHVAGIIYIFQEVGNANAGFITSIDYEKGEFRVGGSIGDATSGRRVVINDPSTSGSYLPGSILNHFLLVGRFGKVHGDWPLWSADTESPSVQASTGFPVCLPRVDPAVEDDPLCPKKNRPLGSNGQPLTGL